MRGRLNPRRGFALVVVIVVVMMLSLSAYTLSHYLAIEAETAQIHIARTQAIELAESGTALLSALAEAEGIPIESPLLSDNPELFEGMVVDEGETDAAQEQQSKQFARFAIYRPEAPLQEGISPDPGPSLVPFGVEREGGRIHLNAWFARNPEALRGALLKLPLATEELVDAVLDWLDADDEPRPGGAEGDVYAALSPPTVCRNGPVACPEELLLVRGMTREIFFGEDANRNGRLDPNEDDGVESPPFDNGDGKLDRGWHPFLTIWSEESNVDGFGRPRISLNDPDLGRLFTLLAREFDEKLARFVLGMRIFGPVGSPPPAAPPTGESGSVGAYRIRSAYELVDAKVEGTWEGKDVSLTSPLDTNDPMVLEKLPAIVDRLSAADRPRIAGRLDLLSASPESIELLTALTPDQRQQILDQRPKANPPEGLRSPDEGLVSTTPGLYWLVSAGILDREQLIALEGDVTVRSPVVRYHAAGFYDDRPMAAEMEVVLDRGVRPAAVRSRVLLDRFGVGTPLELLGRGAERKELPKLAPADRGLAP